MPRRELLTELQRLAFTEPASEEREMVRLYTLTSEDLALIDRRRRDSKRLGFAVLLCYLRFPGRTLRQDDQPPAAMPAFIAEQLALEPANFGDYAERDQTRREHLAQIHILVGYRICDRAIYRYCPPLLSACGLLGDSKVDVRRVVANRCPLGIYFRTEDRRTVVLAVFRGRRDPAIGRQRP